MNEVVISEFTTHSKILINLGKLSKYICIGSKVGKVRQARLKLWVESLELIFKSLKVLKDRCNQSFATRRLWTPGRGGESVQGT